MEGQVEDDPRCSYASSATRQRYFQTIPSFDGCLPCDLCEMDVTGPTEWQNRATCPSHIPVSNLETRRKTRRDASEWQTYGPASLLGKRRLEFGRCGYGMAGWFGKLRPGHGRRVFGARRQITMVITVKSLMHVLREDLTRAGQRGVTDFEEKEDSSTL